MADPPATAPSGVVLTEDTAVRLPISKLWALLAATVGLLATLYGFHASAVASITEKVDKSATALRTEREERLRQHPTWAEIRQMREEDLKYWDSRLDRLENKLTAEIRRNR